MVELMIYETPVPKGRPRFDSRGHVYTPEKTRQYEQKVKSIYAFKAKTRFEVPVHLDVVFMLSIPRSLSQAKQDAMAIGQVPPAKKPDIDNLVKGVMDALNGVAWPDDRLVVSVTATKRYAWEAGVKIRITEWSEYIKERQDEKK